MPSLHEYRRKRQFNRTPEPTGRKGPSKGFSFVIQKHAARRLHYDFRLELDGVLLSWAVPKGPSLDPSLKRLATQTEDHPIEYANFEGTIPKGEYGGGTVLVWDRGSWEPEGDPRAAYDKGHLAFRLHGEKLHGRWHLVRTRDPKGRAWILFKSKDEAARSENGREIVEEAPDSVISGLSLEAIAAGRDRSWQSDPAALPDISRPDPSGLPGARRARMPGVVHPQLAVAVDRVPEGDDWVHEIQLDGARIIARLEKGRLRLLGPDGEDWRPRVPSLVRTLETLDVESTLIDGELVVLDRQGRSDRRALEHALSNENDDACTYHAFDLLHLDGFDLTRVPLVKRKEALSALLGSVGALQGRVRYTDHVRGSGGRFHEQATKLGVSGIVSKRADAPYGKGRAKNWVRVPCARRSSEVASRKAAGRVSSLSNSDRVLYPEQGITKRELGDYYTKIAEWILPHVENRLLTLVRCPEGHHKDCFYQKHAKPGMSPAIRSVPVVEKGKRKLYTAIADLDGLMGLVQLGVLEIHVWGSRIENMERPDRLVFDLDPAPDLPWRRVLEGAGHVREYLQELELESFVKTTGGKGLHVVVPIRPELEWDEVKLFCKAISEHFERAEPNRYLSTMSKAKRKGKIFIDYLRNGRGATSICAYSTRARHGAPVSVPLAWDELNARLRSDQYNTRNLPRRLASLRHDPWEGFFELRQRLRPSLFHRLRVA